jgi:hypothetical protein
LPPFVHYDLRQALLSLEKAFKISELLPEKQRLISAEAQKLYRNARPQSTQYSDTETGSTEVESLATEVSEIHLVGESFKESSNSLEEPIEPSPGPENCPMDLDVGSPENISVAPLRPIEQPPTTGVFKRRLVGDLPREILPVLTKWIDSKWIEPSLRPRVFPVYLIVGLPRDTLTYRQSKLVFSSV